MEELAKGLYGYSPPEKKAQGPFEPLGLDGWVEVMAGLGLELVTHKVVAYERSAEEGYEWQRVPVFAAMMLPGLEYKEKMAVFERAYWEVIPRGAVYPNRWIHFAFRRKSKTPPSRAELERRLLSSC
jgi:hypothetical protein